MKWTNVEVKGNRRRGYPTTHSLTKGVDLTLDDGSIARETGQVHSLTKSIDLGLIDDPLNHDLTGLAEGLSGVSSSILYGGLTKWVPLVVDDSATAEVNPPVAHQVTKSIDLTLADSPDVDLVYVTDEHQITKSISLALSDEPEVSFRPPGQHSVTKSISLDLGDGAICTWLIVQMLVSDRRKSMI